MDCVRRGDPEERLGESEREDLLAALGALENKDARAVELVEGDMDVRETRAAWNALEDAQRVLRDAWRARNLQASGCNHCGEYVPSIPAEISEDPRNDLTWGIRLRVILRSPEAEGAVFLTEWTKYRRKRSPAVQPRKVKLEQNAEGRMRWKAPIGPQLMFTTGDA